MDVDPPAPAPGPEGSDPAPRLSPVLPPVQEESPTSPYAPSPASPPRRGSIVTGHAFFLVLLGRASLSERQYRPPPGRQLTLNPLFAESTLPLSPLKPPRTMLRPRPRPQPLPPPSPPSPTRFLRRSPPPLPTPLLPRSPLFQILSLLATTRSVPTPSIFLDPL